MQNTGRIRRRQKKEDLRKKGKEQKNRKKSQLKSFSLR